MIKNTKIDWNDPILLQDVINKSNSKSETVRNLGYFRNGNSTRKLNAAIEKFDLDLSGFYIQYGRWNNLETIIKSCYSMADVLRAVGLSDIGGNSVTAKKHIKRLNLDISHFCISNSKRVISAQAKRKISNDKIFIENSEVHRSTIKNRIIKENLIEYKCRDCGIDSTWNKKPIVLQLEHINGIRNDNRLENLTFLCPNCHSQTATWGGRNTNMNRYTNWQR